MIYVLSDIHGHKSRLDDILQQIDLRAEDHLYVLGDCVDRNPHSLEILQAMLAMPNATVLLGNHEHMMLEALTIHDDTKELLGRWYRNGGDITHGQFDALPPSERTSLLETLRSLPVNIPITCGGREFLLVHGAPIGLGDRYADPVKTSVWHRFTAEDAMPDGPTLIFGHTPTKYYQPDEPMRIWHGTNMIGIDCGCAYPYGRLACLRLDDMKEFYSAI